ncbi:MAG: DUF1080 domain-containing protein [Planctomycetes bacterium]|nr:DUF1080 domain-containing protein [Planctomycetota bacterium]
MMKIIPLMMLTVITVALVGCSENMTFLGSPKETALFNGKDFTGWKLFIPDETVDVTTVWSVKDGVIHCTGVPTGYLRTEADYSNYQLHVEWRWPEEPGNSGILFHKTGDDKVWPKCIECQLKSGSAGDFFMMNGTYFEAPYERAMQGIPKKTESTEKPIGQWNTADITCLNDSIKILINGQLQNQGDQSSDQTGAICLQSEGKPIQFRNITLKLLQ